MRTIPATVCAWLYATVATVALAQSPPQSDYRRFPGEALDSRTLSAQQKVEALYRDGAFERALLIYEKELAPIGDKYAQYMVGYMHLNGQGAPPDRAEALAWYRLAAERGEGALVMARDTLETSLAPAELARSDTIFGRLWPRYSDRRLLLELVSEDLAILRDRTDSRRPDAPGPGVTIVSGYFGNQGGEAFYRDVRERLLRRMQYLDSLTSTGNGGALPEDETLKSLERQVERGLEALRAP